VDFFELVTLILSACQRLSARQAASISFAGQNMSGGYFNYVDHRIHDILIVISELITENEYSPETMEKFKEAAATLHRASIMTHRIDWLVSGDDSEATFREKWAAELSEKPC
jgi:hypothetical protein